MKLFAVKNPFMFIGYALVWAKTPEEAKEIALDILSIEWEAEIPMRYPNDITVTELQFNAFGYCGFFESLE